MRWPWSSWTETDKPREQSRIPVSWSDNLNAIDWDHYKEPKNWVPTLLVTSTVVFSLHIYRSYMRRIPGTNYVQPDFYRKRSLFGRVTSVGDGDNFHLFHTPGGRITGWGWLRRVPTKKLKLKNKTIPIRIAGVDAPECAHFGKPAQPYSAEALAWLTSYINGRRVRAKIHRKDQYDRIVATVFTRRWGIKRDVGLEMLKCGLATTYEAKTGAEFGGLEKKYRAAEAFAKERKLGMWAGKAESFESPRDFKNRMIAEDAAKAADITPPPVV